jgi:hypothetical protein
MDAAQEDPPRRGLFQSSADLRPPQNTKFRNAIHAIVNDLEKDPPCTHSFLHFHRRHQIKRRRLYDVINVFTAVGCATRLGNEEIVWHGRSRIFAELLRAKATARVDSPLSLVQLFPAGSCVSLSSLTVSFLLLYAALRVEILDLRRVSAFFSRNVGRYKTTLCKLYQIAMILGALDVTERHCNVCEIKLLPPFTQLLGDTREANPLSIPNLLNRHGDKGSDPEERRGEFAKFLIPHGAHESG